MNACDRTETAGWTESMPVTNYYTVNGEINSESTDGVYLAYLTDALGSVTVNQSALIAQEVRHSRFGALLSGTQFKMCWAGGFGYRTTSTIKRWNTHLRQRQYDTKLGQCSTRDQLSLAELARAAEHSGQKIERSDKSVLPEDTCLGSCAHAMYGEYFVP